MVCVHVAVAVWALSGAGQTVFLDFYSDNCGPCRAMDPTVQELLKKGYPVRKVNIDQDRALAAQYGVSRVPCYVMVVDGREVDRVLGGTTLFRLENMCKLGLAQASAAQGPPGPAASALAGPAAAVPIPTTDRGPPRAGAPMPGAVPPAKAAAAGAVFNWSAAPPPRNPPAAAPDDALIAASVRLRIEDANGHSCGSGTIIDARGGEALILTCGHIFRDSQGKGRIEVDLFGPDRAAKVPGDLVSYDLKGDVGLVRIRTPGPVATARVAPAGYRIGQGEPVISVGCNNGSRPIVAHSRVTSLDKYLGPPNLQVAGQPVEGRSGGGLFSNDGLVIGVCNAADPSDKEGLYAALATIHAELDRAGLAFVYKSSGDRAIAQASPAPRGSLEPLEPPAMPHRVPADSRRTPVIELPARLGVAAPEDFSRLPADEQATLEEVRRRLEDGAEILCIVRPRRDPQAKSEIIMLDKASPEFLRQLAAEVRPHDNLRPTSLEIPRGSEAPDGTAQGGTRLPATPANKPVRIEWSRGQ